MGTRIAPLLAIVYLDHIEKASLTNGVIPYKPYINDVFAIGASLSELSTTLANLKTKDANIKFTLDEPSSDGFLPFLNAKIRICDVAMEIRWYKKPSSKNITLHSRRAHVTYMKANVVQNLIGTRERIAADTSETDETTSSLTMDTTLGTWPLDDRIRLLIGLHWCYRTSANALLNKSTL